MPEQPGVVVKRSGVVPGVAGQEADPVQGVEVAGAVRADVSPGAIHGVPCLVLARDGRCLSRYLLLVLAGPG